jgi:hypothetical protein
MADKAKDTFELVNDLIIAISHLLWPILCFSILFIYKDEISGILKRLKKGKILGQELELDKDIDDFNQITIQASESIPPERNEITDLDGNDNVTNILDKSISDPKIGIILLSREIEKELNSLIASTGLLKELKIKSVKNSFELLAKNNYIAKPVLDSLAVFWNLRNKIIHGKKIEDDSQLIRVLDIGVNLYNTLKSIPHEKHIVYKTDIPIYSDMLCNVEYPTGKGLMLESFGIEATHYRIFPTLKTDYKVGDQVSWEWSFSSIWQEAWYRDPDTNEIKMAWGSAAEFIGRSIDEI